ncbi:MAG: glycosyl transferase [Muribaculaceae bacterium]|nr:glycosyl transferase [Muribaculaceae bacterium]
MTVRRIAAGILRRFGKWMPDKIYLKWMFRVKMGHPLCVDNPRTFNEKLQWLKLHFRRPETTAMVDKIEAKEWAAARIGREYIIPTYAVWDRPEDIDLDALPDSFVLKSNHFGGNKGVFIVRDKAVFNLSAAVRDLRSLLRRSIYDDYREWPYRDVRRRVFAEELIGHDVDDFKFFCYDGYVESVMVCSDRASGDTKFYFFDKDWQLKRYNIRGLNAPEGFTLPRPKNVEKMFELASELSRGFPFVRVDLYDIDGRIYFGEMTFFPDSGMDPNLLPSTDAFFGSLIKLPQSKS